MLSLALAAPTYACALDNANSTLVTSCMTWLSPPSPGQVPSLGYAGGIVPQGGRLYLSSQTFRAPGLFLTPPRPGTGALG